MRFQIHWVSFLVSFSLMILYTYMVTPKPRVVIKHPTPFNAGKIVYRDAADTCYVFDAKEVVPCDKKKTPSLKKQPILEKFLNQIRVHPRSAQ